MSSSNATPATSPTARRVRSNRPGIYFRVGADGRRRYEYVYRDAHGKQRWVSGFLTQAAAEDARGEVRRRIRRGERVDPIKLRFTDYADQWLGAQTQLRDSTVARYDWAIRKHLAPRFGRLKLGDISDDAVACLIADMRRQGYAPATVKAVLGPLSLILGKGSGEGPWRTILSRLLSAASGRRASAEP